MPPIHLAFFFIVRGIFFFALTLRNISSGGIYNIKNITLV